MASFPFSYFITGTWQLLLQRLQLRQLSCSSEWPLLLLWIFLFHHYYRVKSMHMISTMDFFFISCVKCQSVRKGAARAVWQTNPPSPLLHCRDLTIGINMRRAFRLCMLAKVFQASLSGVTLSRALPRASSSCSHPRLPNTCHCQSQGDNTQMILSFGLIKSPSLFELQSLQQIIAALRF